MALVNRVIIMRDGVVVMDGPKEQVLAQLMKNEQDAKAAKLAGQKQANLTIHPPK